MRIVDLIRAKRDGDRLPPEALAAFVNGVSRAEIPDYQASAFLMAAFFRGLDHDETAALTRAMLHSGRVLERRAGKRSADKHSTGGVGDKTSLIIAPLAAAAGLTVPMISGRGLGHTGGTLDKLESIPGFRTNLALEEFESVLEQWGCAMIGQTAEIAPADRKLYALRDVTATVENLSLITASILSKKLAEGIDVLVLDVKVGSGAFMKDLPSAQRLAESMVRIGGDMGVQVTALLTDMEQPLGATIGNALEVAECLDIMMGGAHALRNGEPLNDLVRLSVELTAHMAALAGCDETLDAARARLTALLASGEALKRFRAMAVAQGADPAALEFPWTLPEARFSHDYRAPLSGYITRLDAFEMGQAAMTLGAGRAQLDSKIDPGAGIRIHRRVDGARVERGERLCTLFYNDAARLDVATERVRQAFQIAPEPVTPRPLILEVIH